jgi:hypothetical protein
MPSTSSLCVVPGLFQIAQYRLRADWCRVFDRALACGIGSDGLKFAACRVNPDGPPSLLTAMQVQQEPSAAWNASTDRTE